MSLEQTPEHTAPPTVPQPLHLDASHSFNTVWLCTEGLDDGTAGSSDDVSVVVRSCSAMHHLFVSYMYAAGSARHGTVASVRQHKKPYQSRCRCCS